MILNAASITWNWTTLDCFSCIHQEHQAIWYHTMPTNSSIPVITKKLYTAHHSNIPEWFTCE